MAAVVVILQSARSKALPAFASGVQHASYSTEADVPPLKNASLPSLQRGTGGRSSFSGIVATVFGATGFMGRYVCNRLGKIGSQIIIPYRGCAQEQEVRDLKLAGDLGQVLFRHISPRNESDIYKSVKYSNVVINLIGRDFETKNFTFHDVNVKIPRMLARISKESGVDKFIHISHLNAAEKPEGHMLPGGSKYLATKWEGEQAVKQEFPEAIIFKPADVFGIGDRFTRKFAHMWRHQYHFIPLWHKGERTIKQPVSVSDLAGAIVAAIKDRDAAGKTFQAVGPKRYMLSDLVDYFHSVMRKNWETWEYWRYDLRYDPLFKLKVKMTMMLPGEPIANVGWDQLERECVTDNYCPGVPTLEDLGIQLTNIEDEAAHLLKIYRAFNYYEPAVGEFPTPPPPPAIPF